MTNFITTINDGQLSNELNQLRQSHASLVTAFKTSGCTKLQSEIKSIEYHFNETRLLLEMLSHVIKPL